MIALLTAGGKASVRVRKGDATMAGSSRWFAMKCVIWRKILRRRAGRLG